MAGAPGSGKSTVANILQRKLGTPLFEFGRILEFRYTDEKKISCAEEEALAFENLVMVAKNYVKHGFKNIIITDLNNAFIPPIPGLFGEYDFAIYTLRLNNEATLKSRVPEESRSSGYRDWENAVVINRQLQTRRQFTNEIFIDIEAQSAEDVAEQIRTSLRLSPTS